MAQFEDPYAAAIHQLRWLFDGAGGPEPGAASLATTDSSGKPSVRTVTVVSIEDEGPAFFLRGESGKGRQLAEDPRAALCFFWPDQQYQAIVEGEAHPLDDATADRLWNKRSREAKLVAWIGELEPEAGQADTVEARMSEARKRFAWDRVPRPPSWVALCLYPHEIDLWHLVWRVPRRREHFRRDAEGWWHRELLSPF